MKKVYLHDLKEIRTIEVDTPQPHDNYVLIKTKATGICGTDVHGYMGETVFGRIFPFHLGHEVAGVVEAVGPACRLIQPGDHVVIDPLIACGVCEDCRAGRSNHCRDKTTIGRTGPGGFSDYIMMPETSVYSYDPKMDFQTAALAEPLACVIHGIERANIHLGDKVLIKGAGGIGQMHMAVARLAGAGVVALVDFNEGKLEKGKALGADYALSPLAEDFQSQIDAIAPVGFDVVIDCTGAPRSVQDNMPLIRNGGTMLIFGVCPRDATVDYHPHEIYIREISIVGSYAFPRDSLQKALKLLAEGKVDGKTLISAVLNREELVQALEDVAAGKYDGKVIISTED